MSIVKATARRVLEAREHAGLRSIDMASALGIASQTYVDLEKGRTPPRISLLVKIADITGYRYEYIVAGSGNKTRAQQ